ncbi:MAG: hypothetical protein ACPGO5_05410 [Patescibacteria group bacterium]
MKKKFEKEAPLAETGRDYRSMQAGDLVDWYNEAQRCKDYHVNMQTDQAPLSQFGNLKFHNFDEAQGAIDEIKGIMTERGCELDSMGRFVSGPEDFKSAFQASVEEVTAE